MRLAELAQLVEHLIRNQGVSGSNPLFGSIAYGATHPSEAQSGTLKHQVLTSAGMNAHKLVEIRQMTNAGSNVRGAYPCVTRSRVGGCHVEATL